MDVNIFDNGGNGAEMAAVAPTGSRITVLLAGVDQYSTRAQHLYDSLMVVSVDTKAKTIAMVSVPRDRRAIPSTSVARATSRSTPFRHTSRTAGWIRLTIL